MTAQLDDTPDMPPSLAEKIAALKALNEGEASSLDEVPVPLDELDDEEQEFVKWANRRRHRDLETRRLVIERLVELDALNERGAPFNEKLLMALDVFKHIDRLMDSMPATEKRLIMAAAYELKMIVEARKDELVADYADLRSGRLSPASISAKWFPGEPLADA